MKSKNLTRVLFVVYLLGLTWIILFKMAFSPADLPHIRGINLIPFAESVIVNGSLDLGEIIDNVIAFIPFGVFAGALIGKRSFLKKIAPVFLISLLFETLQYVLAIGASDITDLLANTLGGGAGIGFWLVLEKTAKNNARKIVNLISLLGAVCILLLLMLTFLANS